MTTENDPKPVEPQEDAEQANGATAYADGSETGGGASEPTLETLYEAARDEAKRNYDSYLRSQAELQNVLKRHERELAERTRYEGESLAKALLDVVDDLERALEHSHDAGEGLSDGVELVLKSLLAALESHGVERFESVGHTFDPALHEAIAMVASSDQPAGSVIEEHRAGYRLRDRLLRAAMVVVATAPATGGEK